MTTFNHQFSGCTLSYILEVADDFLFLEAHPSLGFHKMPSFFFSSVFLIPLDSKH